VPRKVDAVIAVHVPQSVLLELGDQRVRTERIGAFLDSPSAR
jgi:hypothetical protein